jgi:hypothetical protein
VCVGGPVQRSFTAHCNQAPRSPEARRVQSTHAMLLSSCPELTSDLGPRIRVRLRSWHCLEPLGRRWLRNLITRPPTRSDPLIRSRTHDRWDRWTHLPKVPPPSSLTQSPKWSIDGGDNNTNFDSTKTSTICQPRSDTRRLNYTTCTSGSEKKAHKNQASQVHPRKPRCRVSSTRITIHLSHSNPRFQVTYILTEYTSLFSHPSSRIQGPPNHALASKSCHLGR